MRGRTQIASCALEVVPRMCRRNATAHPCITSGQMSMAGRTDVAAPNDRRASSWFLLQSQVQRTSGDVHETFLRPPRLGKSF